MTNKIFSYLLAGLAIIASDTAAQKAFLEENEGVGIVYSIGNIADLATKIDYLFKNRELLNNFKLKSSQLAIQKYNWELETTTFLNVISNILS